MDEIVTLDSGETCKVVHRFGPARLLIDLDGLYVLADLVMGAWVLSGRPATPDERKVLDPLVRAMGTTVRVVKH